MASTAEEWSSAIVERGAIAAGQVGGSERLNAIGGHQHLPVGDDGGRILSDERQRIGFAAPDQRQVSPSNA
jgi:hypothetical protein